MDSSKLKWVAVVLVVLVVLGGGGYWAYSAFARSTPPPDPVVNELKDAVRELAEHNRNGSPMEERLELVKKMAEKAKDIEKLNPEEKKQIFRNFQGVVFEHVDKYFELPPERRQEQLDADIDFMVFMQKMGSMFFPRGNRGNQGQGGEGASGGGNAEGGQAQGRGQGGPGGFRDFRNMSPEERDKMRREWLDTTTPEQRAKMTEYRRQFETRAKERGVPLGPQRRQ